MSKLTQPETEELTQLSLGPNSCMMTWWGVAETKKGSLRGDSEFVL